MIALRNAAIVAVLALGLTVLPAGGNIADGLLTLISLVFLGAIGMLAVRFWKSSSLTRDAMTDRQRGLIYAGLGVIALMIAGTDELLESGPGAFVWIALLAASGWLIFNTWRQANSY